MFVRKISRSYIFLFFSACICQLFITLFCGRLRINLKETMRLFLWFAPWQQENNWRNLESVTDVGRNRTTAPGRGAVFLI